MSTAVSTVDDRLDGRWGPSDRDRDAWLAFRRSGITATEIRDLHLGAIRRDDLIAEKLGRRPVSFGGNRYTTWGSEREPIIAASVLEHFAIAPESRVVRAADNARKLASPDGLGPYGMGGDLCVSEIKTSGADISLNSPAFEKKGYLAQIVWTMRVTGAVAALYAWEERHEVDGAFHPGATTFAWVYLDDHRALLAELDRIADEFLAALDAAALQPWEEASIDEDLDTLAVNVLTFRAREAEAKAAKESAWSQLQERLAARGGDFRQESILARITYNAPVESTGQRSVVDVEAAMEQHPSMHEALLAAQANWNVVLEKFTTSVPTVVTSKAGLTVTAVKQKGSKA